MGNETIVLKCSLVHRSIAIGIDLEAVHCSQEKVCAAACRDCVFCRHGGRYWLGRSRTSGHFRRAVKWVRKLGGEVGVTKYVTKVSISASASEDVDPKLVEAIEKYQTEIQRKTEGHRND